MVGVMAERETAGGSSVGPTALLHRAPRRRLGRYQAALREQVHDPAQLGHPWVRQLGERRDRRLLVQLRQIALTETGTRRAGLP
ncbi:hypothetical protein GCM10023323_67280 [Streptomyces thinghirensis]|uniref:Uncharacterized protein n=1 Tax=Streptomyces thinghirensis TaxID=551547 RepID=A0ABP9TG66_9ACTN